MGESVGYVQSELRNQPEDVKPGAKSFCCGLLVLLPGFLTCCNIRKELAEIRSHSSTAYLAREQPVRLQLTDVQLRSPSLTNVAVSLNDYCCVIQCATLNFTDHSANKIALFLHRSSKQSVSFGGRDQMTTAELCARGPKGTTASLWALALSRVACVVAGNL